MDLSLPSTAGNISRFLGARLVGLEDQPVSLLSPLETAQPGSLCFLSDRKSRPLRNASGAFTVITKEEWVDPSWPVTFILSDSPKRTFAEIARKLAKKDSNVGISPLAHVHPSAKIGADVWVGPYAVVCEGVEIGARTRIYPHVYLGPRTQIGEECSILSHTVLVQDVVLRNRVRVFPGTVIGSEGFGFHLDDSGKHYEMPQLGRVIIDEDVRIGAHCTIDRGTLGETRIGAGTKIDDQVHIGHNCQIEKTCILCGQVGLSGSAHLEEGVILAGQAAVADHVRLGKGARLAGQSATSVNLPGGESYLGTPAVPLREGLRLVKYFRKLPEMWERLKAIELRLGDGERRG